MSWIHLMAIGRPRILAKQVNAQHLLDEENAKGDDEGGAQNTWRRQKLNNFLFDLFVFEWSYQWVWLAHNIIIAPVISTEPRIVKVFRVELDIDIF